MSFFSFLKKNKESYSIVFNIGSGSISGGIIRITEKTGVDVIYYAKDVLPFQQKILVPKYLDLMKLSLVAVTKKIQTEGLKLIKVKKNKTLNIDKTFFIFSSPWGVSQTKIIKIKEAKPFKVTVAYLDKLIIEHEKKIQTSLIDSGKIIEKKIVQIKINGYVVNNPYGKLVNNLEVAVLFSIVPENILEAVESVVSKSFHLNSVWCHSTAFSIYSVISTLFPQKDDYIHMEVGEEITDISIINNGVIVSSASIPLGKNHFVRELSNILKVSEEIASSMINMQSHKNNDQLASLKIAVSMDTAARNWFTRIFQVLDGYKSKMFILDSIFVTASNEITPFLKDKLQKHGFNVLSLENKHIKSSTAITDDLIFKLELMFLDNLYKI